MLSEGNDDDDDDDEAASCSSRPQQQSGQGISKLNFRQLLVDISDWYDGIGYINVLKVLYRDHVSNHSALDSATDVMTLLRFLIGSGHLSSTNLTILYDTVKSTEQSGFESEIKNRLPSFRNLGDLVVSKFTYHRQRLLKLGMALTQPDVKVLDGVYNMPKLKKYEDSWSLIMDLEHRMELCEGQMDNFIKVLRCNRLNLAVKALLDDGEVRQPILNKSKLVLPRNQDVVIREYLLSRQQRLCRNANRFTPAIMNTRYQVDIAHMFTDLDLLKENKIVQDAKPISLEEFLDIVKSTPACKVLIEGEGGIGKSTLLRYLAYNWATKRSDETFKGKIVFLVNIRDIDKDKTILDAILKQIDLEEFSLKTNLTEDRKLLIKGFIMNHDDEIVLLLDGLDELRDGSESPISFFKKEKMDNSMVILTSRSENIDEFIKESSVHVNVKGFNADNIRRYIKKHFDYLGVSSLACSLIRELGPRFGTMHKSRHMELCKNPMLLLLVCNIWEERQHLPTDKADLYKEVFRCILNQFNKQEPNYHKISKFEDIPEKYVNAMLVLGKCMYEGLKINRLYINKTHLEGNDKNVALALKLGFVYKDTPSLKDNFEQIFTAPHKLIVESLVGFYLYKLCQTAGLENECTEDMEKLLKPLDDNEWEMIRESEYLYMARRFAIGFLGADAARFLTHWITNSVSTYCSLIKHCEFVKEEHRVAVEMALLDHMTKKDLERKPLIDDIVNSLKKFLHHMNRTFGVNEDMHLMKLMKKIHCMELPQSLQIILRTQLPVFNNNVYTFITKCLSSKENSRMVVHILLAVRDQQYILDLVETIYTDDILKYLTAELQKINLKYDITNYCYSSANYIFYSDRPSASYLVHLLSNAPQLTRMKLDNMRVVANMFRKLSRVGIMLELKTLEVYNAHHSLCNVDGRLLASFLMIAPKLRKLTMDRCRLSGITINDMTIECSSRRVKLELETLIISGNDLSNIDASSLVSLMSIAPKLRSLNMNSCILSNININDMIRECSSRGVKLDLNELSIRGNNLSNTDGLSLASLMIIAPKVGYLDLSFCSISGIIMNDMIRDCSSRGVSLELHTLNIQSNNLSNIDYSSLASLMVIAPKLCYLDISSCSISGIIINDMIRECSSKGVRLELHTLDIQSNNLSNIDGSLLASLMDIAPKLHRVIIRNCSISVIIMNDMMEKCFSRGVTLTIE